MGVELDIAIEVITDAHDAASGDGHIGLSFGTTGAVEDGSPSDDEFSHDVPLGIR
jgi:hypothetical protein